MLEIVKRIHSDVSERDKAVAVLNTARLSNTPFSNGSNRPEIDLCIHPVLNHRLLLLKQLNGAEKWVFSRHFLWCVCLGLWRRGCFCLRLILVVTLFHLLECCVSQIREGVIQLLVISSEKSQLVAILPNLR